MEGNRKALKNLVLDDQIISVKSCGQILDNKGGWKGSKDKDFQLLKYGGKEKISLDFLTRGDSNRFVDSS